MAQAPAAVSHKFTTKQWLLLIGCGVGFAITGADPAIFSANIADIRADLSLSGSQTAFIASLATLMLAATILGAGVLGDILGKKKMFIVGALITAAGEVLVALAPDFVFLMVARTVVGIGFAFLLGLSLTIVNSSFPPEQRPRAIGMYLAVSFAACAPMPAIAGLVSTWLHWRAGFLVFALFGLVTALIAWRYFDTIPKAAGRKFDVPGIALAAVTLVGIVYGISKLQDGINAASLVPLGIGVAGMVAFIMVEKRVEQPALDLRLFQRKPFNAGVVGGAVFNFFNGGFTLLVSYYLVVVEGRSAAIVGLLFIPAAILQAFAANWAGRSIVVRGNRKTMMIGLSVLAATALIFASLAAGSPMWLVILAFAALSVGNALSQTPEANLMMSFAPRELGGSIAGVKSGLGQTFYSLGPVVFTLVGTLFLRGLASDDLEAAGYTSEDVRRAMEASQGTSTSPSAGGATVLDPEQAAAVTEAIREPFAQALQLTSLVMLAVPIVALVLVHWLLPKRLPGVDEAATPSPPAPAGPHTESGEPAEKAARSRREPSLPGDGASPDPADR
ncbi:MFS transporter [Demequina globuliformis]|uniref:MFS transporter n=1 Tax=Demequina globuliformis TaxID=676202 RepID=UPI00078459D8|nr:MFS transporter [Demequina globuliformis]